MLAQGLTHILSVANSVSQYGTVLYACIFVGVSAIWGGFLILVAFQLWQLVRGRNNLVYQVACGEVFISGVFGWFLIGIAPFPDWAFEIVYFAGIYSIPLFTVAAICALWILNKALGELKTKGLTSQQKSGKHVQ
ncbi:MAG: hypothetical protein ABIJ96_02770 [Elusimicrobiota bacterium]